MRRRARILFAAATILLLILIALAGALTWLTTTRSGFDWALERARTSLPESVAFDEAEGRLIGPITVRGLDVRTEGTRLRIDEVQLRWSPGALLRGRVVVDHLGVDSVDIEQKSSDSEPDTAVPELPERVGLPLPVTIERFVLDGATLHGTEGQPRRIDRLSTRLAVDGESLRISELELASRLISADGRLRLGMAAPYPVEGRVAWRAEPPGSVAAMAGELELAGSVEALELTQRWHEPSTATLTARLRLFAAEPEWQARLDLPSTPLTAWSSAAPEYGAGAQLELAGSFERASVSGAVDVTGLPTGPVRARIDAAGEFATQRLTLERLHVEPTRPGAWLTASGTAGLEGGVPQFDLTLAWNDLAWPLTAAGDTVATSESGRLHIAGTPEDYRFQGDGHAWAPAMDDDTARLQWRGRGSTARLDELATTVDWRGARLEADGRLDWMQARSARFDFALEALDPARFSPELTGRLRANGGIEAQWGEEVSATLQLDDLSGELNGRPVAGNALAGWRDGRLRVDTLDVTAGDARLQASGGIADERVELDWSLNIPQLAQLLPQAEGSLDGEGSLTGAVSAPSARFRLNGSGLAFEDLQIESLAASGDIDEAGDGVSRIGVRLRDLRSGENRVGLLQAGLRGTRGEHRLALEFEAPQGQGTIEAIGGWTDGWRGQLERAELRPAHGLPWRLAEPAGLVMHPPGFELGQACWLSEGARVCAEGGGELEDWQASLRAQSVPLARVAGFWRDDLSYGGQIGLSVDLMQSGGPVTGEARLDLSAGRIDASVGDTTTTLIRFDAGEIRTTLSENRVDAMLALPLHGGGELEATAGMERAAPYPLSGRVRAAVRDLELAAELVPQIGEIEGGLSADLELGGSLGAPTVNGEAELQAERVSLPDLGVDLSEVELIARTAERSLTAEARARSGEGRLSATLELAHEGERGWQGSGTVAGGAFTVADLPELHATVAPELQWRVDGREISVDGRVEIPSARIEPRDLSNAVQTSPDAVVVRADAPASAGEGAPEPEEIEGWRVNAEVRVVLGEQVRINAFGLDADLGGDIRIIQRPGRLTNATGELSVIEGTYSIYRQTLTIERGRVLFTGGPLSDPGLDIRAVRRPRNVLVGVNVRGTLRRPRAELFSEPPMEESQVLSYLIVGLPLNETSSGERTSVAAAAAALASSRQGERLASEFGIDEVTVEDEAEGDGASLVLGRYLSPRLYVGYGIGLLEQADSVRVRYELSQRWTVESRSGATSSADLLYSIESD
ncbi:MAG: translocation/assembly module TamB domain-containing protein [Halofilum sp. (in: g-proteobacteria)]